MVPRVTDCAVLSSQYLHQSKRGGGKTQRILAFTVQRDMLNRSSKVTLKCTYHSPLVLVAVCPAAGMIPMWYFQLPLSSISGTGKLCTQPRDLANCIWKYAINIFGLRVCCGGSHWNVSDRQSERLMRGFRGAMPSALGISQKRKRKNGVGK